MSRSNTDSPGRLAAAPASARREALALCAETERLFADPAVGGWFATSAKHETLLAREKPAYDGAIPSGTSVAILNALRAATFTGDHHWRAIADRAFGVLREPLSRRPLGLSEALVALDFRSDTARAVVVVWPKDAAPAAAAPLLAAVRRAFLPNKALVGAIGEGVGVLAAVTTLVAEKRALAGEHRLRVRARPGASCRPSDPAALARQLHA